MMSRKERLEAQARYTAAKKAAAEPRVCVQCGKPYQPGTKNSTVCSTACAIEKRSNKIHRDLVD